MIITIIVWAIISIILIVVALAETIIWTIFLCLAVIAFWIIATLGNIILTPLNWVINKINKKTVK